MMSRVLTLLALLTLCGSPLAAEPCVGTTEELLQCHSIEVKSFLKQWVLAWGNGDIESYLSLYVEGRTPRSELTRSEWEAHRRARIGPRKLVEINLKLESMGLEDSGIFDVIFLQHYQSDNFQDRVRKRLFLVREAGELRIWKEEVLLY